MSKSDSEQKFVRCNLKIQEDAHPELYQHLERISEKARAEEIRHLMRIGLMITSSNFNGFPVAQGIQQNLRTTESTVKEEHPALSNKSSSRKDGSVVAFSDGGLDMGDDLLDL